VCSVPDGNTGDIRFYNQSGEALCYDEKCEWREGAHSADSLYIDRGNPVYVSSQIFSIILFIMAVPKRLRLMFDSIL